MTSLYKFNNGHVEGFLPLFTLMSLFHTKRSVRFFRRVSETQEIKCVLPMRYFVFLVSFYVGVSHSKHDISWVPSKNRDCYEASAVLKLRQEKTKQNSYEKPVKIL